MKVNMEKDSGVTSYVLRRKNGVFYIVLVWYEGAERRRETHSIGNERNKSKAKRKGIELAREKEIEIEKAKAEEEKHIFVDTLSGWIENMDNMKTVRHNTIDGYRERSVNIKKYFNMLSEAQGEEICIEDISAKMLLDFYNYMLLFGKVNRKTGEKMPLSRATVQGYAALLHKFFDDVKDINEWIEVNPCDKVKVPKVNEDIKKEKYFTYDQLHQLIDFMGANPRYERLVGITKLCTLYGLRRSECLALRWSNVDWKNECVNIRRTVVRVHGGVEDRERLKAKASYRTYPIMPEIADILDEIKEEQCTKGIYSEDGLVFTRDNDKQWSPDYCSKLFKAALKACGFAENMSFKTLRSTCVCIAHEKGWTDSQITDWVGHTSFKVTRDHYLVPTKRLKDKMGATLSDVF